MRQTADRDPLSTADPSSPVIKSIQSQQELLQQLALRGAWRSILEAIKGQQAADQEQLLCQAAYYTLALAKLRNYSAANAEMLKLGNLNSAHLNKVTEDAGLQVSMVPFALRRQHMVVCNLVNRHVRSKEYKVALRWLSWLLTERRDDPGLWSVVGYVQLMLGDIAAADRTFQKAAELLASTRSPDQQRQAQALIRRHQGLLLFARNDFAGALLEFEASGQVLSQAAAALQSRALVYVYSCNLGAAIQVTEDSMQSDLIHYVSEPLLANLCTMYELMDISGNEGADGKTRLLTLIGGILPDDFDASFMQ
ncbi:hypothetical protein WJX79_009156 [Trebouxia sp. C0005]